MYGEFDVYAATRVLKCPDASFGVLAVHVWNLMWPGFEEMSSPAPCNEAANSRSKGVPTLKCA